MIPATAVLWEEELDPTDILDFEVDCSSLLDDGDSVSSFTVLSGIEAGLLGLVIATPSRTGNVIRFWLSLEDATESAFEAGALLPVEVTITTAAGRKVQRTAVVKVVHK